MKINGIAHIVLTVNRPELALPFYERLFGFLELKTVFRHERGAYFIAAVPRWRSCPRRRRTTRQPSCRPGSGSTTSASAPTPARTSIACTRTCARWAPRSCILRKTGRGAGLLLGAVRGPRRHPAGGEPRPGKGPPHRRGSLQPRWLRRRGLELRAPHTKRGRNVRFWHKADMPSRTAHVRSWG